MEQTSKDSLRKQVLVKLRNQGEKERLARSLSILDKLVIMNEFQSAKVILFYAPFDGEVDTLEMIKQAQKMGKHVALPRIDHNNKVIIPTLITDMDSDLEKGPYGIQQPKEKLTTIDPRTLELVMVPGVAFDRQNQRLGRGGGYYDRFLKQLSSDIPTIGLAFHFQIVDKLSHQEIHDIPVTYVLHN